MKISRPRAFWHKPGPGGQLHFEHSARGLKRAVTVFASTIVAATLLLLATVAVQLLDGAETHARDDAYNLAGVFEDQVARAIGSIRAAMSLLKPRLAAEGAAFDLVSWVAASPEVAATAVQVSFIGPDGKLLSTSLDRHPAPVDLSGREHFQVHMAARPGLFAGKPVLGRVSNRVTIQISDRVESADGRLAGVVVFSIAPDFLMTLPSSVHLGRSGFMILAGTDGTIRAAYAGFQKPGETYPGTSISGSAAFLAAATDSARAGTFEGSGPLNGEEAYAGWRKIAGYPLVAFVGIGKAEALEVPRRGAWILAVLGAVSVALTLGMTAMLRRETSRRVAREIALHEENQKVQKAVLDLKARQEDLLLTSRELANERECLQQLNAELVRAKEQAVSANQAKTSMLMNMSHEFRTPMHAILNYTAMSLKKVEGGEPAKLRKYLENINTSGIRLLRMLNALLDLAKLESGKFDLHLMHADLAHIVEQAQSELGSLFEARQLRFEFECRTPKTDAVFDPAQMLQVFVNLFSNAVKFSPRDGTVTATVEERTLPGDRLALYCSVADQGCGIPEGELEAIFGKFTQSSKNANGAGGSGLGLTICREIVHLHQGKIWASNGKAGGAVFHLLLPLDLAASQAPSQLPAKPAKMNAVAAN